jgi:serine/threonine protein kinase
VRSPERLTTSRMFDPVARRFVSKSVAKRSSNTEVCSGIWPRLSLLILRIHPGIRLVSLGTISRMPLADGQTFAGYRILRMLGSGGMGEVYLAQHPRLPRTDALKVLGADVSANPEYEARFAREADLASTLWHPHIVGVHDRGEDDGQLWISMDYVDGLDAARLLNDKFPDGMPAHHVAKIVTAVASALDHAHGRGLLHRDIKPANIMLTNDEQRILLADFGIARSVSDVSSLTATGFTMGTVAYAAPEQLTGEELDGRADQYGLAATAYHLLTGSHLFPHSNPAVVIGRHLNALPTALAETKREFASLDPVLATALAKNRDDRFSTCKDFARAFALAQVDQTRSVAVAPTTARAASKASAQPTAPAPLTAKAPVQTPQLGKPGSPRTNRAKTLYRLLAVLGVVGTVAALALWIRPWQRYESAAPGPPPSATPSTTFDGMRNFVEGYYSDLPADPTSAWKKVDSQWQKQTGYQDFLDFWATIDSVSLVSVSPRDATSVIARVHYVPRNGQPPSTEDRWLRMTTVDGRLLLDGSGRIGAVNESATTSTATGPIPPSAIDTLLPDAMEVSRISGAGALKVKSATDQLSDNASLVTPSRCVGVIFGDESAVYAGTSFTGIRDQILQAEASSYDSAAPTLVEQTVIAFATPDQANATVTTSQRQWQDCARGLVSYRVPNTNNEVGWSFNFGEVQLRDNVLTVSMAGINRESGNSACQQVLGARANIVVGVRSCNDAPSIPISATVADPDLAGQSANRLAGDILSRVQG